MLAEMEHPFDASAMALRPELVFTSLDLNLPSSLDLPSIRGCLRTDRSERKQDNFVLAGSRLRIRIIEGFSVRELFYEQTLKKQEAT